MLVLYWIYFISSSARIQIDRYSVEPDFVCIAQAKRVIWLTHSRNIFSFVHFRIPALTNLNRFSSQLLFLFTMYTNVYAVERLTGVCAIESREWRKKISIRPVEFRLVAFCPYSNVQVLIKRCSQLIREFYNLRF